jgi:L-serine dehydratase
MKTSIFDVFKIGIGPSSSHTVGPMRAAREFAMALGSESLLARVARIQIELFGSLALTGRGHGTDRAVQLGLQGETPDEIDPDCIDSMLCKIRERKSVRLLRACEVPFEESRDLLFVGDRTLPGHSNALRFTAFDRAGQVLKVGIFYSIGGGFICGEHGESLPQKGAMNPPPYPFSSAAELLRLGEEHGIAIWQIVLENEKAWRAEVVIREHMSHIWLVMKECVDRGLQTEGILPGGLNVRRRASALRRALDEQGSSDPLTAMDWVNAFAMAVSEENAAGSRVVTAPTNGAAGIIPAVAYYYLRFVPDASEDGLFRLFLTATAVGALYTENASISGAEVGCQGEVGVACSMAAGGLVSALGGSNQQAEYAAEIGMEHNLGMTCDPLHGLVQIPCIERNAMGAVKAINACRIAMREPGEHKVSLDQVIATMYQTGLDMRSTYKETSLAGLGTNVTNC